MHDTKLNITCLIVGLIAVICSCILIYIIDQETYIDKACAAIEANDNDVAIQYLKKIKNYNSIGQRKETVLMVACESGNAEIIAFLLTQDLDVNYCPNGALTPLELFCQTGYKAGIDALDLLLEYGVKQSNFSEKPAVFYLAENLYWMEDEERIIAEELILSLMQNGAPFGYKTTTILHEITKADSADLFDILVHTTQGLALLNTKNSEGKTPWDISIQYGAVDVQRVIRFLEEELRQEQNPGDTGNWNDTDTWPDLWPDDDETIAENESVGESENKNESGGNIDETTEEFNIDDYINDYLQ